MKIFNLTIILTLVLSVNVFSQKDSKEIKNFDVADWTIIEQINGVNISYKVEECNDAANGIYKELVFIQITNATSDKMKVSWSNDIWYDNTKAENRLLNYSSENNVNLTLDAGETIAGSCIKRGGNNLVIHAKFLNYTDKPQLTKIILNEITVTPL